MSSELAIVFTTRSGHCRTYAEALGARLKADAHEIGDLVPRKGLFGFLRSGAQASSGKATPIRDPGVDLSAVRHVVLVQPIWASSVVPPLRTWLRAHTEELRGRAISVLVSYYGSPLEHFRLKFEREFGPMAAFAAIAQSDPESVKASKISEFSRKVLADLAAGGGAGGEV
ncbi:MAG TPA: hypothetical protein VMC79_05860 [Rectinemataceae bacterium]|nr:hypothetical protein [Rectinemataceae bacterium]